MPAAPHVVPEPIARQPLPKRRHSPRAGGDAPAPSPVPPPESAASPTSAPNALASLILEEKLLREAANSVTLGLTCSVVWPSVEFF